MHIGAFESDRVSAVELEPVSTQNRLLDGRDPAGRRLEAVDQLAWAERLGHAIVGTGVEGADLLLLVGPPRDIF